MLGRFKEVCWLQYVHQMLDLAEKSVIAHFPAILKFSSKTKFACQKLRERDFCSNSPLLLIGIINACLVSMYKRTSVLCTESQPFERFCFGWYI